jgi:DNA-binding Lrp family transcriptional regulator
MDALDRRIVNSLQGGLPVVERPYREAARQLGIAEAELIERLRRLLDEGTLSRFGPMYDVESMGGALTLAAMAVPEDRFEDVAGIVNGFAEVAHNYRRGHPLNMWFVVSAAERGRVREVLAELEQATGLPVLDLPKQEEYFLDLRLEA